MSISCEMQTETTTILEYQPPLMSRARAVRSFFLVLGCFLLFGIILGAQGVVWPDVFAALRIGEGVFGTAQLVSPAVAMIFLLLGGFWSETLGLRKLIIASLVLLAISNFYLAGISGLARFVIALLFAGIGNGLMETSMNAATLDWERATGKQRMNLMHAGFSAGAIGGALGAGMLLAHGWRFSTVLVALMIPCAAMLLATLIIQLPPQQQSSHDPHPLSTLRLIAGNRELRMLALLAILGVIGESVAF